MLGVKKNNENAATKNFNVFGRINISYVSAWFHYREVFYTQIYNEYYFLFQIYNAKMI